MLKNVSESILILILNIINNLLILLKQMAHHMKQSPQAIIKECHISLIYIQGGSFKTRTSIITSLLLMSTIGVCIHVYSVI